MVWFGFNKCYLINCLFKDGPHTYPLCQGDADGGGVIGPSYCNFLKGIEFTVEGLNSIKAPLAKDFFVGGIFSEIGVYEAQNYGFKSQGLSSVIDRFEAVERFAYSLKTNEDLLGFEYTGNLYDVSRASGNGKFMHSFRQYSPLVTAFTNREAAMGYTNHVWTRMIDIRTRIMIDKTRYLIKFSTTRYIPALESRLKFYIPWEIYPDEILRVTKF